MNRRARRTHLLHPPLPGRQVPALFILLTVLIAGLSARAPGWP